MHEQLLRVEDLRTYFHTEGRVVKSVDGVSFLLNEKETFAIVGESGCGKSVTSLSIMRIIPSPPGRIESGEIWFRGKNLLSLSEREMKKIRGKEISMIFQEPMTSLNPVFTVEQQILQVIRTHQNVSKQQAAQRVLEMVRLVGIPDPERVVKQYPHQLSGGMKQRIMIAMALSCNPQILIADEPTTALDVTIQKQILNLLVELKKNLSMSVILITHDLGVVAEVADKVMVMYAGQAVECASVHDLFKNPLHPYTKGLLQSIPTLGERKETLYTIEGTVPDAAHFPEGCRFADRYPSCMGKCRAAVPKLTDMGNDHRVRCYLYGGEAHV